MFDCLIADLGISLKEDVSFMAGLAAPLKIPCLGLLRVDVLGVTDPGVMGSSLKETDRRELLSDVPIASLPSLSADDEGYRGVIDLGLAMAGL